jgi:hypothetical protein
MIKPFTGSKTTGEAVSRPFDEVCERLAIPETADAPREIVALRIVELASNGERDPERLRDKPLKSIGGPARVP